MVLEYSQLSKVDILACYFSVGGRRVRGERRKRGGGGGGGGHVDF